MSPYCVHGMELDPINEGRTHQADSNPDNASTVSAPPSRAIFMSLSHSPTLPLSLLPFVLILLHLRVFLCDDLCFVCLGVLFNPSHHFPMLLDLYGLAKKRKHTLILSIGTTFRIHTMQEWLASASIGSIIAT